MENLNDRSTHMHNRLATRPIDTYMYNKRPREVYEKCGKEEHKINDISSARQFLYYSWILQFVVHGDKLQGIICASNLKRIYTSLNCLLNRIAIRLAKCRPNVMYRKYLLGLYFDRACVCSIRHGLIRHLLSTYLL